MAIFITGDIHSEIYPRFNRRNFSIQKELTKDDIVIICGDFGIPWSKDKTDEFQLKELQKRNFTTVFVDGNHENFDALYNDYPIKEWNGGKVHVLNDSVLHLMRGQVFTIQGKKIFTFGGAPSHDTHDGVLEDDDNLKENIKQMHRQNKIYFRINHLTWWKEEMPSDKEYREGLENLAKHNFKVDYIISHEAPSCIREKFGLCGTNAVSEYLQQIKQKTEFDRWYFGHHHIDMPFYMDRTIAMYEKIHQIA